jgi:protein TonB
MFEDATFDSRSALPNKTPQRMVIALGVNVSILTALLVFPLVYPESLSGHLLRDVLYVPPVPVAPAVARTVQVERSTVETVSLRNPFEAPTKIPGKISMDAEPALSDAGNSSTLMDVIGAPAASTNVFHAAPAHVVVQAAAKSVKISGGVAEGRLLFHPTPAYPVIAKVSRTEGTVVLAATIDHEGKIANLRVMSGPAMLQEAAVLAVSQWRYRPYMLNNQPVDVETTVNVVFSLGGR